MPARARHRQHLLWTIKRWLARHSFYSIALLVLTCSLFASKVSAAESKTAAAPEIKAAVPAETKPLDSVVVEKQKKEAAKKAAKKKAAEKEAVKRKAVLRNKVKPNIVLPKVDAAEAKAESKDITIEGAVGGRSFYGLAVTLGPAKKTTREIWFNLVQGVQFIGVKSVMDLQDGDKVKVVYRELAETKKKILKSVQFLQKAPPEPIDTTPEPPPPPASPEPEAENA